MRRDLLIQIQNPPFDGVCEAMAVYLSFEMFQAETAAEILRKNDEYVALGMTPIKTGVFQLPYTHHLYDEFSKAIDEVKVIDVTDLSLLDEDGNEYVNHCYGRYFVTVMCDAFFVEVAVATYDPDCDYRSEEVMVLDSIPTWEVLFKTDQPQPDENLYELAAEEMDDELDS